eukprot:CAMPEP_0119310786 /NCGR_PEP_ID=MMETSP1333-20130426/20193_1 /TAXON_ID=418940 /ORGANISM="Scyphosphaera apsteinii, Strain RCC1455" /LENGTH=33 /DNA_ID= /DNA_START= /DNA_END= /DNA_ORIENTATION=
MAHVFDRMHWRPPAVLDKVRGTDGGAAVLTGIA